MKLAEFVRAYPLRSKNIGWFFGAGSSVSAGMPTAGDLTWEFKRRIFCSEERLQLSHYNNLSDPAIRNQIQAYFDSKQGYPEAGSVEEYSFYFERAFPAAIDRSNFLRQQLSGMQNSFGHKAIGVLMKNNHLPLIFTTNFDKAFENSAVEQYKRLDDFFVADLENNSTAIQKYNEGFRPIVVKLHGDYFSERLKNTSTELQEQDKKLRQVLYNACLTNGIAVMGYSGRDESIIQVLKDALSENNEGAFSNGLFWFSRAGSIILPEVLQLIDMARARGIQAEFIEIETFDTAWADIAKGFTDLPSEDIAALNMNYYRKAAPNIASVGKSFPVIRLNAIRIEDFPTSARLAKCEAGTTKEIKELLLERNVDLLAIRKRDGVVGFGSDNSFQDVLSKYGTVQLDVYGITDKMLLDEDSSIKGLITETLAKAICRERPLKCTKRQGRYVIFPDPKKLENPVFSYLKQEMPAIIGKIHNSQSHFIAALEVSIQVKFSKVLLVMKPTLFASKSSEESDRFVNAAFIKEATARWYNKKFQLLFEAWINTIFGNEKEIIVSAYGDEIQGFTGKFKLKKEVIFAHSY